MIWFNETKKHGFIASSDGERIHVAAKGFTGKPPVGRVAGLPVSFEVVEGPDGDPTAVDVVFTEEIEQRRARRRGSSTRSR
jgi:cold shock CspA family protein